MAATEGAASLANGAGGASSAGLLMQGQGDRVSNIYGSVHRAILEHRLLPGTKLPEDQLGAIFGVSRTLIRAVLQSLARDGMIVQTRNRSASVASPTPQEARELFEARRVIEPVIVKAAVERMNDADAADLRILMQDGRDALAAGDRGRAIRLSGSFHLQIARVADQSVLAGFLDDLVARSSLVIALYGQSGRSDCGNADHDALLDAFDLGNADLAQRLMIDHLKHIEADLELDREAIPTASLAQIFATPDR